MERWTLSTAAKLATMVGVYAAEDLKLDPPSLDRVRELVGGLAQLFSLRPGPAHEFASRCLTCRGASDTQLCSACYDKSFDNNAGLSREEAIAKYQMYSDSLDACLSRIADWEDPQSCSSGDSAQERVFCDIFRGNMIALESMHPFLGRPTEAALLQAQVCRLRADIDRLGSVHAGVVSKLHVEIGALKKQLSSRESS